MTRGEHGLWTKRGLAVIGTVLLGCCSSCGVAGPPIPPEHVGIGPLIEQAQQRDAAAAAQAAQQASGQTAGAVSGGERPPDEEHGEGLPPLRPVGTR